MWMLTLFLYSHYIHNIHKFWLTMEKELNIEEVLKEIDEDLSYFTKEMEELEELMKDPSLNWAFLHILKTFLISLL